MTDYAIDIERLQALLDCTDTPWQVDALTAAIALMRAAEPKDAEAELAHCNAVVNGLKIELKPTWFWASVRDTYLSERAAARAEGYVASTEACELHVELSAANAKIQRLEMKLRVATKNTKHKHLIGKSLL